MVKLEKYGKLTQMTGDQLFINISSSREFTFKVNGRFRVTFRAIFFISGIVEYTFYNFVCFSNFESPISINRKLA